MLAGSSSLLQILTGIVLLVLHAALVLGTAPLLAGGMQQVRARFLGCAGPQPLQPWRDLMRLVRKQPLAVAEGASPLFLAAPAIAAAAVAVAALLVPSFTLGMATAPVSDLLLVAGLLALARTTTALAAFDAGIALGGMGASRTVFFAVFVETALLLVLFVLALLAGTTNLDAIAASLRDGEVTVRVPLILAFAAASAAALADTGRMPVDDPATLLELAGTNRALLVEYSGRHLALVEYAGSLRLLLWLTLLASVFMPFGLASAGAGPLAILAGLLLWPVKVAALALGLALLEAALAVRLRVFRVPELLGAAILLGLLAAMFLFVGQGLA